MGFFRLTLLTVICLGGVMMYFGRNDGLPDDRLGRERLPEPVAVVTSPVPAAEPDPAPAPVPEPEPEPEPVVAPEPDPTPAPAPEPEAETVLPLLYVTGSRVNMRSGPSTANGVVAALTRGTAVDDMGPADDGWLHIRVVESGLEGYMAGRFLSPDAP